MSLLQLPLHATCGCTRNRVMTVTRVDPEAAYWTDPSSGLDFALPWTHLDVAADSGLMVQAQHRLDRSGVQALLALRPGRD